MGLPSYPKVFNLGHPSAAAVFFGGYYVEEKLDGSQFSFGENSDGELHVRSKGAVIDIDNPPNLFRDAVATAVDLHKKGLLTPGYTFRCEAFQSPKHNTLAYARKPDHGLVVFDIEADYGKRFLDPHNKYLVSHHLGLESVQTFRPGIDYHAWHPHTGAPTEAMIDALLHQESMLGTAKVEGVVFKNYTQPSAYGPVAFPVTFVKYVNPAFRELNATNQKTNWSTANKDVVDVVLERFNLEAIWSKAIQHLGDEGKLLHAPEDIGPLLREINTDFEGENRAVIEAALYSKFRDKVMKGVTSGFPQWYKARIASDQLA